MTKKQSLLARLKSFITNDNQVELTQADLQVIRSTHQKLDTLLKSVNIYQQTFHNLGDLTDQWEKFLQVHNQTAELKGDNPQLNDFNSLTEQVHKLAKTQFKTNTLQETQLTRQQETVEQLQKSLAQQEKMLAELKTYQQEAINQAEGELLKSFLPILDSLDAAFETGRRQILHLPLDGQTKRAVIAWLDGVRLARMRLLDVFAACNVQPIPAVGHPFDPHYHVAVATDTTGRAINGIIVGEDRRGYIKGDKVLRFAEVVVARTG